MHAKHRNTIVDILEMLYEKLLEKTDLFTENVMYSTVVCPVSTKHSICFAFIIASPLCKT